MTGMCVGVGCGCVHTGTLLYSTLLHLLSTLLHSTPLGIYTYRIKSR